MTEAEKQSQLAAEEAQLEAQLAAEEAQLEAQLAAEEEARLAAEKKAEKKGKPKVDPEQEKKNRLNSLREQAIALRDQGKLAPIAVVEYFAAGTDTDFDAVEEKLKAFAE
jgi:hypothetical protein